MHKKPPGTLRSLYRMLFEFKFYKDIGKAVKETNELQHDPNMHMNDFEDFLPVGSEAPDFELSTIEGEWVKLSDLKGNYVVLEFGAYT